MGGAHAEPVMHPTEITNLSVNHLRGVDVLDNGGEHVHEFGALHIFVGVPDGEATHPLVPLIHTTHA
jgi:hypothetical protein